ncbi:MAG: beta-hexosaminidase [Ruminococcus sp.]|nr:beta-hexosaminidase [Ruminococcus sp.]
MKKGKFALLSIVTIIIVFAVAISAVYFLGDASGFASGDGKVEETVATEAVTEAPTEPNKVEILVNEMSLEEKVAQMIMVSCHEGVNTDAAASYGVGGICLYSHSFADKNADEVKAMIDSYQNLTYLPMLVSTDEEGGTVTRISSNPLLRETPFLSPMELFSQGGMDLVKSDTQEKSQLLLSLGVNVNLAPVCDVPLDQTNYIYDRCFSLNADETASYVQSVVSVMEENEIGSCLKHFPGYGGSVDTHQSLSYDDRDYSAFENGDYKPFEAGINAGADCVLVSHNIVNCIDSEMPASLSISVHNELREKLGFNGVIMTDDLVMEGIQQFTDGNSAAVLAVKAGNDMIICEDYSGSVDAIVAAVNNGEIDESQIDESVKRILKWKFDLGLLE